MEREIKEAGGDAISIVVDVRNYDEIEAMIARVVEVSSVSLTVIEAQKRSILVASMSWSTTLVPYGGAASRRLLSNDFN